MFDSVWVGDNFVAKPRLEAIVSLAVLAGRTRRLRLGTICLASFPQRQPLQLAIQWASLDVLSGGRTILAVCTGAAASMGAKFADELAAFGVASRERAGRMEEGIGQPWQRGPDASACDCGDTRHHQESPVVPPILRRACLQVCEREHPAER